MRFTNQTTLNRGCLGMDIGPLIEEQRNRGYFGSKDAKGGILTTLVFSPYYVANTVSELYV